MGFFTDKYTFGGKPEVQAIASITITIVLTTALFYIHPPSILFTHQLYELGIETIILLVCIFTIILRPRSLSGEALGVALILSLFLASLSYKWQVADHFYFMLGGFLPLSDANEYYNGAQNVIYGFDISGSGTNRPMFTSFLAVIMKAANGNIQTTVILLVILNALAVYFATREIQQTMNSNIASAIYLVLCYMYFRRFSGTLLTENLGFCLGNLALVFLIRGSTKNKLDLVLYGLFLLTTSLNARAGAFFILPMLAIWSGFSFRSVHGFWRSFFLSILVVMLGMATNLSLAKLMNSPTSKLFSNYSYTLYGIASGNKGWEQVEIDYPNASNAEIYALAFQKIKENPALFIQGIIGTYSDYFGRSTGAFSFVLLENYQNKITQTILWGVYFIGFLIAAIKIKQKIFSICLAFVAGILLSVSLVPPIDSSQMRAYAATIPASIYVIAIGFASFANFLKKDTRLDNERRSPVTKLAFPISVAILVMSFILPVIVKETGQPPKSSTTVACLPEEKKMIFLVDPGSSIILELGQNETNMLHVNLSHFTEAGIMPDHQLLANTESFFLKPGMFITISKIFNEGFGQVTSLNSVFLVTNNRPRNGSYTICTASLPSSKSSGDYYYMVLPPSEIQDSNIEPLEIKPAPTSASPTIEKVDLLLIFILVFINFIEIQRLPIAKYPHALGSAAFLILGILVFIHSSGLIPLSWDQKYLASQDMNHINQFMYEIDIKSSWMNDTSYWNYPINFYENNTLLGFPHENKSIIKTQGMGSYTITNGYLFFSTSDNSDPKINRRNYIIEFPTPIRLRYQAVFYVLAVFGLFIQYRYINNYKI